MIVILHISIQNMNLGIINWASMYFVCYVSLDFIGKSLPCEAPFEQTSFLFTFSFALLNFFTLEKRLCCKEGPSCSSLQHPPESSKK